MKIEHYVTNPSVKRLPFLLNIGFVILGITVPVLSQTYPQAQPTITPATPTGTPSQPIYPAPTIKTPQPTITPAMPTGASSQPTIVPAPPTSGTPQPTIPATGTGERTITIEPKVVNPNINELVTQWGWTPINCDRSVVSLRMADKTVCVKPTPQLPPGDYTYNPTANQISPVTVNRQYIFTNLLEYSKCLEDILRLYEDKEQVKQQGRQSNCREDVFQASLDNGLSKTQTLEIIDTANFYATSLLNQKLYPPRGQRVRVAKLLGFIYQIDANDEIIRRFAAQGSSEVGNTNPTKN